MRDDTETLKSKGKPDVNSLSWISFKSLLSRECKRYLQRPIVMIGPPILTQFLYIIVFGLILGSKIGSMHSYSYISFMFPGLVMMALISNSFMNPSWSLFAARHHGWIEPILSSPLSYTQMVLGYVIAGVFRGLLVGTILLGIALIVPTVTAYSNFVWIIGYFIVVSFLAASVGCIVGLLSQKHDHIMLIMNFAFFPLVFLGGVFYSVEMVEGIGILEIFVRINPVTYMINGMRYGMIGMKELPVLEGLVALTALAMLLLGVAIKLFHDGYNLRS
ncbi:MAG: ABC transporter permease [Candidatus Hadarchaeia archaeon]